MFFRKKIKKYTVVEARDMHDLIKQVDRNLKNKWACVGGVQHVQTKTGGNQYDYTTIDSWIQAMIREET